MKKLIAMGVVGSLLGCGDKPTTKELAGELKSKSPEVRAEAAEKLGEQGAKAEKEAGALKDALSDKSGEVRKAAADSLTKVGKQGLDDLTAVAGDDSSPGQAAAASALGDMGAAAKPAVPVLLKVATGSSNADVRFRAMQAIAKIGPSADQALPAVTKGLSDSNPLVRAATCDVLAGLGPAAKSALPELEKLIHSDQLLPEEKRLALEGAAKAAAKAKGAPDSKKASSDEANDLALDALRQKDDIVRVDAAVALWKIDVDGKAAVKAFTDALVNPDPTVRWYAVQSFGRIGPAAGLLKANLQRALEDKDERVRAAAKDALQEIEQKP